MFPMSSTAGSNRAPPSRGCPLSDYLLPELRRVAERPTLGELRERLQRRPSVAPNVTPEQAVRAERDAE